MWGFLTGILVWLILVWIDFEMHDMPFAFHHIGELHSLNKIWYILDLLPIVAAIIGIRIGIIVHNHLKETKRLADEEVEKSKKILSFTQELSTGNLNVEITSDDILSESVKSLRDSLLKSKQEEERHRIEEEHHNWATEGQAFFADIMRKNTDDLEEFSYNIISQLVKYMGANQGGFFILEDENKEDIHFQLKACYAYERRKFANKRIEWGEGLIGTCALEMEPIYMTDIPEDYIEITSGLGHATPRSIIMVPLKLNDTLQGVIEIASFKTYQKYECDFINKLAESIASTIYSVKNNVRTSTLLEQSKRQAQELAEQEEKLRQNLEVLRATQEQAAFQSKQFEGFVNSVNHTMMTAEFNTNGTLIYANTKFLHKLLYQKNAEVEGKNIFTFLHERDTDNFNEVWMTLVKGGKHFEGEIKLLNKYGEDFWAVSTFVCMRKADESIEKILFLGTDINTEKKKNLDYEGQIQALNISSLKAEFRTNGSIIAYNNLFETETGYTQVELEEKSIFNLLHENDVEDFRNNWRNVIQGSPYKGQIKMMLAGGVEKWLQSTLAPVNDIYGDVIKLVLIANDITEQKIMEIETQQQAQKLIDQEDKLKQSQAELAKKLDDARKEMKEQFHEIEMIKVRNEKTLEGALDAIMSFNQNGFVQFFNKAAENLWGYDKADVMNKKIDILFSEESANNDEFVKGMITPGTSKPVGYRKEVQILSKSGESLSVLVLLSEAEVNNAYTYTAFIQNIEVELF